MRHFEGILEGLQGFTWGYVGLGESASNWTWKTTWKLGLRGEFRVEATRITKLLPS